MHKRFWILAAAAAAGAFLAGARPAAAEWEFSLLRAGGARQGGFGARPGLFSGSPSFWSGGGGSWGGWGGWQWSAPPGAALSWQPEVSWRPVLQGIAGPSWSWPVPFGGGGGCWGSSGGFTTLPGNILLGSAGTAAGPLYGAPGYSPGPAIAGAPAEVQAAVAAAAAAAGGTGSAAGIPAAGPTTAELAQQISALARSVETLATVVRRHDEIIRAAPPGNTPKMGN